jgi:hypothetical protein
MFTKVIESEIEWCEKNDGAMPMEFRKGFIAGLRQAVYLINATKQRMVWQDGEMIDDKDLLDRAAELQRAADQTEQKCPSCGGSRVIKSGDTKVLCPRCTVAWHS